MCTDSLSKVSRWRAKFERHRDFSLALSLFVLLVSIYSLTYSGTFITDDEHILASRTLSLAFDEQVNNTRVYGNTRLYFLSTLSPDYSASAMNVEPGQAVLGSVLARMSELFNIGHIQTLYLLNIWVIAFTAVILFFTTRLLEYSKRTSFYVGILFGLGTIVWPYTKTYFRDPLAMMFLTMAWASALIIVNRSNTIRPKYINRLAWLGLVAGTAAGILTKNTITLALPALFVYILIKKCTGFRPGLIKKVFLDNWKKLILLLGSVLLVLILWSVLLPARGIFARFALFYYKDLAEFFFTTPHPSFFEALIGPLFSPGKSIFIYSPILVLSILGLIKYWDIAWPVWVYLILLIIGQALFYDDEWWGFINWGLRFILPAIPLLMIAAIPVIDSWLTSKKGQIGLISLGGFSILIQVIGTLPPLRQYYTEMIKIDPSLLGTAALWNFKNTALVWHFNWLFGGGALELAAVRVGARAIPIVIGLIVLVALNIVALLSPLKKRIPYFTLALSLGLTITMLATYSSDPAYYFSRHDLRNTQEKIRVAVLPGDLVVLKSYNTPAWQYWMNWADPGMEWIALPLYFPKPILIEEYELTNNPEIALDEATLDLFHELPDEYHRVWLVLPGDTPGATLNIEVDWLKAISASNDNWRFTGDRTETQLYLFELTPP